MTKEEIKTRLKLFYDMKLQVHISLYEGGFRNGFVVSMKERFIQLLDDRKQIILIDYKNIRDIEKYFERKGVKNG